MYMDGYSHLPCTNTFVIGFTTRMCMQIYIWMHCMSDMSSVCVYIYIHFCNRRSEALGCGLACLWLILPSPAEQSLCKICTHDAAEVVDD